MPACEQQVIIAQAFVNQMCIRDRHVDSLMSYDFTGLTDDELEKQLAVVDDRRILSLIHICKHRVDM